MKATSKKVDAVNTNKSGIKESKSKDNKKNQMPYQWRRIKYFFDWFDVDSATAHLWEILKLAITYEEGPGARERSNMIFFYEHSKELFENIHTLLEKQKEKYGNKQK